MSDEVGTFGFGVGFSKAVEAILGIVQLGATLGVTYIYPHEVRENLRRAGMRLDKNLLKLPEFPDPYRELELPEDYQPDFTDDGEEYDIPEEEVND